MANLRFTKAEQQVDIVLNPGEILFVLGANGSGKSSLMQKFFNDTRPNSRRITAHRQTWFSSNTLDITPSNKRNTEHHINNSDASVESRYMDNYASQRATLTIFDLIDAQNVRARSITSSVDAQNISEAIIRSKKEAPLAAINKLLVESNIPVKIDVIENEQIVASKNNGPNYSIAELSDGERNALLIAGDVLTAKEGAVLIIDEPERHLHRSIISPLLTALFEKRKDCSFVIATHDVDLPLDNKNARVLLVRSATYQGSQVLTWEADLLEPGSSFDDDIKRDLLGSRRRIVFVEGRENSLDKPLYSLLFPMVSIIAKETCKAVEQAVVGLRASQAFIWAKAWGIVDGDNQSVEYMQTLREKGVFAVPFYSVESIYYHPWVIRKICEKMASVTSANADTKYEDAISVGIQRVRQHVARLAIDAATKEVREKIAKQMPTVETIMTTSILSISIDTSLIISAKTSSLNSALDTRDWEKVIAQCSIRESGALDPISKACGMPNRKDYEAAVRTLLQEDQSALTYVRGLLGEIYNDVHGA